MLARHARRGRPPLGGLLLEVLLIVLGIVLALGVDEWRQGAADRGRVRTATADLMREIAANRTVMARRLAYHEALRDSLRVNLRPLVSGESDRFKSLPQMGFENGFGFFLVERFAWETTRSTGTVVHMPYETVRMLSRIYDVQQRLEDVERRTTADMADIFGHLLGAPEQRVLALIRLEPLFYEVPSLEASLLKAYDTALERLGGAPPPDSTRAAE